MEGLVHVGAAVDHFGELPLYTAVFASLAATQIVWAGLLLRDPSRRLLLLGALFNLSVCGGLDASALTFEITETTIMRDVEGAGRRLALIKGLGVRVVIDDFGTGYSSMAQLQRYPSIL